MWNSISGTYLGLWNELIYERHAPMEHYHRLLSVAKTSLLDIVRVIGEYCP